MTTQNPLDDRRVPSRSATVSVLIRTTGRSSLGAAIASVATQSFDDWEIVVVNASGHALKPISPALARQISLVIEPGHPLGRSAAANALLKAASGRYAVFLDDDDELLPAHLQKLVEVLDAAPELVACYSDVRATIANDEDGTPSTVHVYERDFDPALLQLQNYLPIHSVMFRLDAARGGVACEFDESLALFEDWDFWLQLAAKSPFRRVPGVSALYALNTASGSGHTGAEGALRETSLKQFAERQLMRWDVDGVVQLIAWQGQRLQDQEQAKQTIDGLAAQLAQASRDISGLAQQAALENSRFSQERAQERHQLNSSIAELNRAALVLEQTLRSVRANEFSLYIEIEKLGRIRLLHLQQIDALNARLLATYQSRSWRLTRPLRGAVRLMAWLETPKPVQLVKNGLVAAQSEVRRRGVMGFVRRMPRLLRNSRTYASILTSPLPQAKAVAFKSVLPTVRDLRLHPDLVDAKASINASISVVIPTFNAGGEFKWLLRKLQTQRGLAKLEVVIVDSGSTDNTVRWARAAGCTVVEITQAEFTHSHARNLGAANAGSDYVLFMVQDAYPIGDHWAYGMLRYLLDHADSGLVAASCSEYPRSDSDMMYDSMINIHYRFLGCDEQDRIGDFQGSDHMALRSRGQLSDVACLISRKMFGQYGYQGDYAEDLDLGIRLIKDGHKVAMLASVKVVHSHNRPAFYYLKRSYVDVIFLVGMFDDFTFAPVESVRGLLAGIVSGAAHVSDLLPAMHEAAPGMALSDVLANWILACKLRCKDLRLDGASRMGDARLDGYVDGLGKRLSQANLDGLARGEAQRFTDTFFARLEHFNSFAAEVYGAHDAGLRDALQHVVRKTFAAAAGSALGFMYMDKQRASAGADQPMVDVIDKELRVGV